MSAGAPPFTYDRYELDHGRGRLTCRYRLGDDAFTETLTFSAGGDWDEPALPAAARLVFLLAGVSYYKTAAPRRIELPDLPLAPEERRALTTFYRHGLGEFAYRHGLDLSDLVVEAPRADGRAPTPPPHREGRPLVPFGGGIDSVVTAETVKAAAPAAALFVVSPGTARFEALEATAALTGLPVLRAERQLDEKVLDGAARGYLNGHVPVTGIVSAAAVMAAVLFGRDAVVMANERSSSAPTVSVGGVGVNHQWSKGAQFEALFAEMVGSSLGPEPRYFSLLRPYSELWVARRFAELTRYHPVFRSCNRAFAIDPARRAATWCGRCDKCCFIDLVLAPFLAPDELAAIFGGAEPLDDPNLTATFDTLVGLGAAAKPFECVGDLDECRAAVALAADRPDRAGSVPLQALAARLAAAGVRPAPDVAARLFSPEGTHRIPDAYAAQDLLV